MVTDSINKISINGSDDNIGDSMTSSLNQTSTQGLWRKGVLVQIQGGVWSMETKLTADDLNLISGEVPEFATLGKKKLLDSKHKNDFLSVIGKARSGAERFGFPFVLTGSYFVPFGNFDRLKKLVEEQQIEFSRKVDSFINRYSEYRAEYLERFSQYREKLETYYPEPEYVRSKFTMNAIYYVASMSGVLSNTGDSDSMYLEWAVNSMNGLRSEARDVADVIRKANSGGNLDGRTMRRVQTLIDRLQNMDMLEDSSLRNAALNLAADATTVNADALEAAAKDVPVSSVRSLLLD